MVSPREHAAGAARPPAGGRRLVLASGSRYRGELLARLRLPFEQRAPEYVEGNDLTARPEELVRTQAEGKARSLVDVLPDALIIGGDQVAEVGGRILVKPGSVAGAIAQLRALRGREHRLLTAICVVDSAAGRAAHHLDVTRIRLRDLSDREIEAYVARDEPVDCAGSYKAESLGVAIFESQSGSDPTAVTGLPLIALCRLLRELGLDPLTAGSAAASGTP